MTQDGSHVMMARKSGRAQKFCIANRNFVNELVLPKVSGILSNVKAIDNSNVICSSFDNVRLWNTDTSKFSIVPGHHGGQISSCVQSANGKYLATASGTQQVTSHSNNQIIFYEIK